MALCFFVPFSGRLLREGDVRGKGQGGRTRRRRKNAVCVCVCVCGVRERERERERKKAPLKKTSRRKGQQRWPSELALAL